MNETFGQRFPHNIDDKLCSNVGVRTIEESTEVYRDIEDWNVEQSSGAMSNVYVELNK